MPESVKSGNIYGSLEASYPIESKYADTTNVALYLVYEFMQDEGKFLQLKVDMEREENERLMDPSAADSTELGEVPHEEKKKELKGSLTTILPITMAHFTNKRLNGSCLFYSYRIWLNTNLGVWLYI